MTFRRSAKDRKQLGCLGGAFVFLLYGAIKWNELTLWPPGMEARRVRGGITAGADWPQALLAADRELPRARQFFATCKLVQGGDVYLSRMGSGYMIHGCPYPDRPCLLPAGITSYPTASEWEAGLRKQLFETRMCRSLVISIGGEREFAVALDSLGRVTEVSEVTQRE